VAVVTPRHSLAQARGLSLKSVAAVPSILREPGSGTREIVEQAFRQRGVQLNCTLQIGSSEGLKRAALEGGGVGWISEVCVAEELRSGRLVELKISRFSLERPLYSLKLRGRHLSRSALTFLQELTLRQQSRL
jgi:DNA-binding transcriptional LysR family regulator